MQIEEIYKIYKQFPFVQTDTRKLKKNDLYFALKGPSFNGNLFAKQALEMGAAYVFTDERLSIHDERNIYTSDVLVTLQQLAKFHRQQFINQDKKSCIPFIAITGSNGKTTTKELLHEVLSSTYKTYTTQGNLNNHIGIPLTILKIKPDAEMAVIEMGANHLAEIKSYCEYTMPTHGLITNVGKAHLEGFGSVKNVKKGKGELFDYLGNNHGVAFVNVDDTAVLELSDKVNEKIFYGSAGKDTRGIITASNPFPEIEILSKKPFKIKTKLAGAYNFSNVLAAVTIGKFFNIDDEKIKKAIENYSPTNSRSQLIKLESNTILLDAYNANPGSMKAAIENFAGMQGNKKVLLLGSMMELGADCEKEHEALIVLIDKYKWQSVVLVGENFNELNHKYIKFDNSVQVKTWLNEQHFEDAQILIKGSRSMQMEKVLE